MAKVTTGGNDDTEEVEGDAAVKWHYLFKMFCVFCVCLLLGVWCVATEWRLAKQAEYEFKAKEKP